MKNLLGLFLTGALICLAASAEEEPSSEKKILYCAGRNDSRVVEVTNTPDGGCEVRYTKFGETKVVANAQNDLSYCEQIYERITQRLNSAAFECSNAPIRSKK